MKTPFTTDQFLAVFEKYNTAVFPSQILLLAAGILAIAGIQSRYGRKSQVAGVVLAVLWMWSAFIYHMIFFSTINKAATVFGILFGAEGIMILRESLLTKHLRFEFKKTFGNITGYFLVVYSILIYPAVDLLLGHQLTGVISLGLPCPTTIMTLGFFLLSVRPMPRYLLIIPVLWSLMGFSAAINFGICQDLLMVFAAILTVIMSVRKTATKVQVA